MNLYGTMNPLHNMSHPAWGRLWDILNKWASADQGSDARRLAADHAEIYIKWLMIDYNELVTKK